VPIQAIPAARCSQRIMRFAHSSQGMVKVIGFQKRLPLRVLVVEAVHRTEIFFS
jgi:hypothetical protein